MNAVERAFLGLGSNLGDRETNLAQARDMLRSLGVEIVAESPVYETEPEGVLDQPRFLNQILEVRPGLEPAGLLSCCHQVERRMGRVRNKRRGPRIIDCDVLLYGGKIISDPELVIPHPRMHERGFVLIPLADLAPEVVHPVLNKTIRDLAKKRDWSTSVRPWTKELE